MLVDEVRKGGVRRSEPEARMSPPQTTRSPGQLEAALVLAAGGGMTVSESFRFLV